MTTPNGHCWAVVAAGGTGQRFSADNHNKLLVPLNGQPVLACTVSRLSQAACIDGFVVVSHPRHRQVYESVLATLTIRQPIHWATGGDSRRASVFNGLETLPSSVDWVAIHDAARPLVDPKQVDTLFDTVTANHWQGGLLALPVVDTLKAVSDAKIVTHTIDRERCWLAQTPQLFAVKALKAAHQSVSMEIPVTDDVQLMEDAGLGPVGIVPGNPQNLKITTNEDWALAQWYSQLPAVAPTVIAEIPG